jgi:hypothetical protein
LDTDSKPQRRVRWRAANVAALARRCLALARGISGGARGLVLFASKNELDRLVQKLRLFAFWPDQQPILANEF